MENVSTMMPHADNIVSFDELGFIMVEMAIKCEEPQSTFVVGVDWGSFLFLGG